MGRGGGGLINFLPLKRRGLLEGGGLMEDLRYVVIGASVEEAVSQNSSKFSHC